MIKMGKAAASTGVIMKVSDSFGTRWMTDLTNNIVKDGCIPDDWRKSIIVHVYKGKSDPLEWRASLLDKGLKVNTGKSKVMVGISGGKMIVNSENGPYGACGKGVQENSVQ